MRATKLFLRIALSLGFLSAVADRFGWWAKEISVWGDWNAFLSYTALINPWLRAAFIPFVGYFATGMEVLLAMCLLVGFRTEWVAKLSGLMLLLFALAMTFSTGIKGAFDYSVFSASAAAFALSMMKEKFLELDMMIVGSRTRD